MRSLEAFPRYAENRSLVPVWCVTPRKGGCIHRFFDTSPISPSGRYLALTRLPYEDRLPRPGDRAEILLIDLSSGLERPVAETRGWDTQLGAQVQWGVDDTQLYYNDVDPAPACSPPPAERGAEPGWRAFGVRLDPLSGARKELEGTVYMVSPDGRLAASPCLLRTSAVQPGYGVVVPSCRVPVNRGAPEDDGITVTDTETGAARLLVSLKQIVEEARPRLDPNEYEHGSFYGFHVKWNPSGERLMFVLRWKPESGAGGLKHNLITLRSDGREIRVAVPEALWGRGGHHPNWCPDGETLMMNLNLNGDGLRFVRVRYDGSGLRLMARDVLGSGHPSLHPDGRHILTDSYLHGPFQFGHDPFSAPDGTVPLRWIDLDSGGEQTLVRIAVNPLFTGPHQELRIDPHPAWDRSYDSVVFNGWAEGSRRVYVADMSSVSVGSSGAR